MAATLTIIRIGSKCMISYAGDETSLAEALTGCALRDEVIAEVVTRAAVEVELHRQATRKMVHMTQE